FGQSFALEIISLAPSRGAPGTLVTVSGGPFSATTQPFLGSHYVAPLHILENRLEFTAPYLPPGQYLLTVQNEDLVAEQAFQFEVMAPVPRITELNPSNYDVCHLEDGQQLEVSGQNFLPGAVLLVNDIVVPTNVVEPTRIEARLRGFRQPGVYGVLVRNPDDATSLPHSLWINSIPNISSIEQGAEFLEYYEVIIRGKNFLPNSILVVKEPEDSLTGQYYRQFSFVARNRDVSGGMSAITPHKDRLVFIDCQTLVYYRYPVVSQKKSLGFMVLNPDGNKTDLYYADLP
ncbi:MAG: IPT/TIG domain-containing protein, partial [Thiobacillus sp.]